MALVVALASNTKSDCEESWRRGEMALIILLKRLGLLFSSDISISFNLVCSRRDCSQIGQAVLMTGNLAWNIKQKELIKLILFILITLFSGTQLTYTFFPIKCGYNEEGIQLPYQRTFSRKSCFIVMPKRLGECRTVELGLTISFCARNISENKGEAYTIDKRRNSIFSTESERANQAQIKVPRKQKKSNRLKCWQQAGVCLSFGHLKARGQKSFMEFNLTIRANALRITEDYLVIFVPSNYVYKGRLAERSHAFQDTWASYWSLLKTQKVELLSRNHAKEAHSIRWP